MRRLRLLRILLPAALILFVALVVIGLDPPPQVHRATDAEGDVDCLLYTSDAADDN